MLLLTLKLANNAPTHPLRVNKQLNTVTVNVPIQMLFWRPNEVYVCIRWQTDSRDIYCVMFKRKTLGPIEILALNGEWESYIIFSVMVFFAKVMVNLEMVTVAFVGVNLEIGHHSSHETFDSTLRKEKYSCEREVLFSKEYKFEYSLCLLKYY